VGVTGLTGEIYGRVHMHICIQPVKTFFQLKPLHHQCRRKGRKNPKNRYPAMASLEGLFSTATPAGFGSSVGLDFFETQLVESEARTSVEDVNDDLKIEVELFESLPSVISTLFRTGIS
jgi:hypothetical protein